MRIYSVLMCTLCLTIQVCGVMGQEGRELSLGGTPRTLGYEDVRHSLNDGCFNKFRFLEIAQPRTKPEEAIRCLVTVFEGRGYVAEPLKGAAEIRAGVRMYPVGGYERGWHLVSGAKATWIDLILFQDARAAKEFFLGIKGNKNRHCGSESPACWVYHTWNDSENSDVGAVCVKERMVVNIGFTLPCPVPLEILIADKYPSLDQAPESSRAMLPSKEYKLSESEQRAIVNQLKRTVDALQAAVQLAVSNMVAEEDLTWMPKAGEDPFGFTARNRIAAFVTLWFEVKYNFAFFDRVPDLNWDSVLYRYLPLAERAETEEDFVRLLSKCMALLHDGHTRIDYRSGNLDFPNILIRPIEGRAVVAELGENDEIVQSRLRIGDEITHVDGRSVPAILEEDLYPYTCASTPQGRDRIAFLKLLEGPKDSKATIEVRSSKGEVRKVTVTRRSDRSQTPWKTGPALAHKELPGNIVYVALNSFASRDIVEQFDSLFDSKMRNAKGLILDVRENGGGSSSIGYAIIGRLIDKRLPASRWKTRQYKPVFRAWGKQEEWYEGEQALVEPRGENPYMGPVVVLAGPGTISAAEDFLIPLHASGRATLVGQRTAGTTGQPLIVNLHGLLAKALICTKRDMYPDGREFVGIGIIPDVEIHPTQADIAAGRDTVLEKGIEVLMSKDDTE